MKSQCSEPKLELTQDQQVGLVERQGSSEEGRTVSLVVTGSLEQRAVKLAKPGHGE